MVTRPERRSQPYNWFPWAALAIVVAWALMGVLKAGAAFTMLDPAYPAARLAAHLGLARPRAIIQVGEAGPLPALLESFLEKHGVACRVTLPTLAVARRERFLAECPTTMPDVSVGPDSTACLGFTSGSTGVPKGIVGRHGPLTHFVPWLTTTFALTHDDRFSMLSGLSHVPCNARSLRRFASSPICVPSAEEFGTGAQLKAGPLGRDPIAHLTPAWAATHPGGRCTDAEAPSIPALRSRFRWRRPHDAQRRARAPHPLTCELLRLN